MVAVGAPRLRDTESEGEAMRECHTRRSTRQRSDEGRQEGMALLIVVLVLILISAMAVAAINHAGEESAGGRRTKTAMDALFGASAGIEFSRVRIAVGNLVPFSIPLDGGVQVESRRRSDTTPQPIVPLGTTGLASENMINVGEAIGITTEMYRVNATAETNAGAIAEVEAKVSYVGPGSGNGSTAGGGY